VIVGGLAELFSGSISMGLGAYLAAVTDRDHYFSEEKRERAEVTEKPEAEKIECHEILEQYGVTREASDLVVRDLCKDHENWVRVSIYPSTGPLSRKNVAQS
jgi:vacuolar iron transporter family protein